jgi:hypothetical protein
MQVQTLTSNAFLVTGEGIKALVEIRNEFQPEYHISGKGAKKFAADIKKACDLFPYNRIITGNGRI